MTRITLLLRCVRFVAILELLEALSCVKIKKATYQLIILYYKILNYKVLFISS